MSLPGLTGVMAGAVKTHPASFVFSGSGFGSGEVVSHSNSTTSPSVRNFTISVWVNLDTLPTTGTVSRFLAWGGPGTGAEAWFSGVYIVRDPAYNSNQPYVVAAQLYPNDSTFEFFNAWSDTGITVSAWNHVVVAFDLSNASATNRIRYYRNGSEFTAAPTGVSELDPSTSAIARYFMNGTYFNIGSEAYADQRLAFFDVVYGQTLTPTSFAFSNGGVWTRKPYQGSYGTYGFSLDGTHKANGCGDVSGNGLDFTPTNWSIASNLDFSDLPPHIR